MHEGVKYPHDTSQLTNWLLVMCHEDTLRLHAQGDVQFTIEPEIKPDIEPVILDSVSDNTIESTDTVPTEPSDNTTTQTSSLEPAIASDDERSNELSDFGFGW